MALSFLPINRPEMLNRGWQQPDFVYVVGEAYTDHPSFGHAIISRVLENAGYKVAMLCLPDWHSADPFREFGCPRLGFLVTAGVIDSMVNHYTVAKKRRNTDAYAPGGKAGLRPDRATTVYCNRIHEAFPDCPILIGGTEASLRRFSHYDYWDDKVRRSILVDSAATLLMFGMGERSVLDCAAWLESGRPAEKLPELRGVCYMSKTPDASCLQLPAHTEVAKDRTAYSKAFMLQYNEQDPFRGHRLCQQQDPNRYLIQNLPSLPLSQKEFDMIYELPYTRTFHPSYNKLGGVPALSEVKFSLTATRGCFGSCNFCAITFHQGRIIQSRSTESLVKEAKILTSMSDFKGYIHDVGGPTANFVRPACDKQMSCGTCHNRQCLFPAPCPKAKVSHELFLKNLRSLRAIPGVRKVFVRSGIRFDYLIKDKNCHAILKELSENHISGQLKVAPEHICPEVLDCMGKPSREVYDRFVREYQSVNRELGKKQYLIPYLMSSHPGSTLSSAVTLACYLNETGFCPEQVQDFYPTPGTLSTCMYYTEHDPRNGRPIYVARTQEEKSMQRALMQFRDPHNSNLVRKALRLAGREDLIGYGRECLVHPEKSSRSDHCRNTPQINRCKHEKNVPESINSGPLRSEKRLSSCKKNTSCKQKEACQSKHASRKHY